MLRKLYDLSLPVLLQDFLVLGLDELERETLWVLLFVYFLHVHELVHVRPVCLQRCRALAEVVLLLNAFGLFKGKRLQRLGVLHFLKGFLVLRQVH